MVALDHHPQETWAPPDTPPVGSPFPRALRPARSWPLQCLSGLSATMERRMTSAGYLTQAELASVADDEIEDVADALGTFPYRLAAWISEARANIASDNGFMRSA
ncbi:MAG: hypothetical protein AB7Q42_04280 [Acidimicrobiia bacterium]